MKNIRWMSISRWGQWATKQLHHDIQSFGWVASTSRNVTLKNGIQGCSQRQRAKSQEHTFFWFIMKRWRPLSGSPGKTPCVDGGFQTLTPSLLTSGGGLGFLWSSCSMRQPSTPRCKRRCACGFAGWGNENCFDTSRGTSVLLRCETVPSLPRCNRNHHMPRMVEREVLWRK